MTNFLERVVKIESNVEHIKESIDTLVEDSKETRKLALEVVELKHRVTAIENKENPPMMSANTKMATVSAGLAGAVIALIEYFKK